VSDPATLAATQSILFDDTFDFEQAVSDILEKESQSSPAPEKGLL
jgi:hypothetical protein